MENNVRKTKTKTAKESKTEKKSKVKVSPKTPKNEEEKIEADFKEKVEKSEENAEPINKEKKDIKNNKKNKIKRNLVIISLILAFIVIYVIEKGKYLEIKEIGDNYVSVFWKNFQSIAITAILNFSIIFLAVNFRTKKIKSSLKVFFNDEKKEMPRLPQKSIALIIALIVTIFTSEIILNKALLCFNNSQFVITDPVFGYDIGYFVFIWPFIELMAIYALAVAISLVVYSVIYYLLVFNICFDGINRESVKNSQMLNQALKALKVLIVLFAILIVIETQNIGVQKFITLNSDESENYSLYGAGTTEINIRFWAYNLFALIIILSGFGAIKQFNKKNTRKVIRDILIAPIYLIIVLLIMIGYNLIFVNSNELDKEKKYIADNINYTRKAYGIDIDDVNLTDGGTITQSSIVDNNDTITNIPIVNSDLVLKDLNNSLTNNDYYKYNYTNSAVYSINGKNQLVFLTPREISNNNSTYSNKTFEYTHGYGLILTSASTTTSTGNLNHIQKSFEDANEALTITQPRIYFGLETNSTVVTNSNSKKEFDYPTTDSSGNTTNTYTGTAGLEANLLDRIVLAIKERDPKLVFSGSVNSDSKILTNRNIINRAKTIMPYLKYDEDPYMVVTNSGELVWVIDAYTTSNNYPYSQRTVLKTNGITKDEINYIRNSVKVIVNAYTGEVTFYITDKTDPIAMAYNSIYPELFSSEEIPEDISSHFTYPKYLYNIQAEVLERYHDTEPDTLYRSEEVLSIATYNTSKVSTKTGTTMSPYYTMVKTNDSSSSRLGLVLPYTPYKKENIESYLIGSVDDNGNNVLKIYDYSSDSNIIGPMQLDNQIEQDTTISKELDTLNITGTKITKDMIIVPINNTLLYVEPVYQQYVNEENSLPELKKVIIASGNKVAIGDTFTDALNNLVSQNAVNIEITNSDSIDDLVNAIIKANTNLKQSTQSNDWEQIGKDTKKLQELINQMEAVKTKQNTVNEVTNTEVSTNVTE